MGSRQQTEGEGVRLPALSRRAILVGTSAAAAVSGARAAAPLGPQPHPFSNPADLYKHWVSLDQETEQLLLEWGNVEGLLMQKHNWYQLSEDERTALPEGQALRDLDTRLNRLFRERDGLLDKLPTRGARSLEAVAARLAVVERLLYPDDHPEAHAMVVGSRRDLGAIMTGRAAPGGL